MISLDIQDNFIESELQLNFTYIALREHKILMFASELDDSVISFVAFPLLFLTL